jgi:hypothetical protein
MLLNSICAVTLFNHTGGVLWALKPPVGSFTLNHIKLLNGHVHNAFDAGSIHGQVGGGWALEILTFFGPKWHSSIGSMQFHRAPKSLDFQGPTPYHLPS